MTLVAESHLRRTEYLRRWEVWVRMLECGAMVRIAR